MSILKKGFTLIETIVCISIISLFLVMYFKGFNTYKIFQRDLEGEYGANQILAFIDNSKQYCREKNTSADIVFSNSKLILLCANGYKMQSQLPESIKITEVNIAKNNGEMFINNKGVTTSTACTITFQDGNKNTHRITNCVGTAFVEIK